MFLLTKLKKDEEKKKKKVKRTNLSVQEKTASLPSKELQHLTEEEGKMLAADRLAIETAEKKNAVESYVYDMRNKLTDSLSEFATESEKSTLLNLFGQTEDWLYGEGADATKSVYIKKLEELKAIGDPIVKRKYEHENRYEALSAIKNAVEQFRMTATSADPKYEHITKEERDKVLQECTNVEKWVTENVMKQEKTPKYVNPVISVADITKKHQELTKLGNTILNRPKPAPPKEEKPKETEKKPEEQTKPAEEAKPEASSKPAESQQQPKDQGQANGKKTESEMDLD